MKLSDLLENPLNRKINRDKVDSIKRAIKISGVIKPMVYTEIMTDKGKENMLTDGHHRYVALKEMGYKDAPVVMADERGIATAQFQDMKTVKKAVASLRNLIYKVKKPCPEGHYRDKDGNCRRRGQNYGGGALIYGIGRRKKPNHGNGETPPTNGTTTQTAKHGSHDQSDHSPTGASAQRTGQATRSRLRSSGSFKQLRRELQSLASNPDKPGNQERMNDIQDELERESRSTRRTVREETKKHGSHDQKDHAPKGSGGGSKPGKTKSKVIPYKGPDDSKGKPIKLKNLVPAVADLKGNVHVGERGQIHIDVIEGIKEFDENKFDRGFVDTTQGIYLTRSQAGNLASEDLRSQQAKDRPKPKSIKEVKQHLGTGTKVMLSAERGNLSPKENATRTAKLRSELSALSSNVLESDSKYGGAREKGFIVDASSKNLDKIKALSSKYKQDSHIVIQNGKATMEFKDGRSMQGNVGDTTEQVDADDNYSSVGGVKFTIPFRDRDKDRKRKMLKKLNELRNVLSKLNRLTKEGIQTTSVSGLELTREDLQDEMAHPHVGRRKKGWTNPPSFSLSEKMDMDEGVDTKHPYKNPDGANVEGGRVTF